MEPENPIFTAVGALESHFFLKNGVLSNFSEQQILDCSVDGGNSCQKKGLMDTAYKFSQNSGLLTVDEYPNPYKGDESGAENSCSKQPSELKISRIETITKGSEDDLKDAVCHHGPVSVALDATSEDFKFLSEGILNNPVCSKTGVTHGVLVVGYGNDPDTGDAYWLIKNSFGVGWGDEGYGRITRNNNNHCGVASLASFPVITDA